MTDPIEPSRGTPRLTEQQVADALTSGIPEQKEPEDLVEGVPRRARQLRTRRLSAVVGSVAAVVLLAVGVPFALTSLQTGPEPDEPAGPGPSAVGSRFCPDGDADCVAVVLAVRKPLRLPALSTGQSCPVSESRTMKGVEGMSRRVRAVGPGPLFLTGPPTVDLPKTSTSGSAKGWRGQKVIWLVDRDYAGPLVLRGARIDRPGELGFDRYVGAVGNNTGSGDGRPHDTLVYVRIGVGVTPVPSSATYPSYPSGIFVKSPGCYAIQVDGVGFSEHLVFRATSR